LKASCLIFMFLLLPEALWAASSAPAGFFLPSLKLFFGIVAVVGIMLLLHLLNRRGFTFLEKRRPGRIKIVEMRPVGGRKSLCLVEVRGEEILLGLGNDRVDFLYQIGSSKLDLRFEKELLEHVEAIE